MAIIANIIKTPEVELLPGLNISYFPSMNDLVFEFEIETTAGESNLKLNLSIVKVGSINQTIENIILPIIPKVQGQSVFNLPVDIHGYLWPNLKHEIIEPNGNVNIPNSNASIAFIISYKVEHEFGESNLFNSSTYFTHLGGVNKIDGYNNNYQDKVTLGSTSTGYLGKINSAFKSPRIWPGYPINFDLLYQGPVGPALILREVQKQFNGSILIDDSNNFEKGFNNINASFVSSQKIFLQNQIDSLAKEIEIWVEAGQSDIPFVSQLIPSQNGLINPIYGKLSVIYDQDIYKGSGNITVYNKSDDSILFQVDVSDSSVVITNNNTLNIQTDLILNSNQNIYVKIDAGVVKSSATNNDSLELSPNWELSAYSSLDIFTNYDPNTAPNEFIFGFSSSNGEFKVLHPNGLVDNFQTDGDIIYSQSEMNLRGYDGTTKLIRFGFDTNTLSNKIQLSGTRALSGTNLFINNQVDFSNFDFNNATIYLSGNDQITDIIFSNDQNKINNFGLIAGGINGITNLDLSNAKQLTRLYLDSCSNLSQLDLPNGIHTGLISLDFNVVRCSLSQINLDGLNFSSNLKIQLDRNDWLLNGITWPTVKQEIERFDLSNLNTGGTLSEINLNSFSKINDIIICRSNNAPITSFLMPQSQNVPIRTFLINGNDISFIDFTTCSNLLLVTSGSVNYNLSQINEINKANANLMAFELNRNAQTGSGLSGNLNISNWDLDFNSGGVDGVAAAIGMANNGLNVSSQFNIHQVSYTSSLVNNPEFELWANGKIVIQQGAQIILRRELDDSIAYIYEENVNNLFKILDEYKIVIDADYYDGQNLVSLIPNENYYWEIPANSFKIGTDGLSPNISTKGRFTYIAGDIPLPTDYSAHYKDTINGSIDRQTAADLTEIDVWDDLIGTNHLNTIGTPKPNILSDSNLGIKITNTSFNQISTPGFGFTSPIAVEDFTIILVMKIMIAKSINIILYNLGNAQFRYSGLNSANNLNLAGNWSSLSLSGVDGKLWHVVGLSKAKASPKVYFNNTSYVEAGAMNLSYPIERLAISAGTTTPNLEGRIAEIIIFNRQIDDSEYYKLFQNLNSQYNLGT